MPCWAKTQYRNCVPAFEELSKTLSFLVYPTEISQSPMKFNKNSKLSKAPKSAVAQLVEYKKAQSSQKHPYSKDTNPAFWRYTAVQPKSYLKESVDDFMAQPI